MNLPFGPEAGGTTPRTGLKSGHLARRLSQENPKRGQNLSKIRIFTDSKLGKDFDGEGRGSFDIVTTVRRNINNPKARA